MQHNQTSNWSRGLGYVQFMKNRALHAGIKRSPYEAMFGQPAKVGLTSSSLPHEVLSSINSEEDLENILKNINCNEESVQEIPRVEVIAEEDLDLESDNLQIIFSEGFRELLLDDTEQCSSPPATETRKCDGCDILLNSECNKMCDICTVQSHINYARAEAKENLNKQAKRMKLISDASHPDRDSPNASAKQNAQQKDVHALKQTNCATPNVMEV